MQSLLVAIVTIGIVAVFLTNVAAITTASIDARLARVAERNATLALVDAERILRASIAAQVAAGAIDGPFAPVPSATTAPSCNDARPVCSLHSVADFTFSGGTNAAVPGSDTAFALQRADGVQENRLAVRVHIVVTDGVGTKRGEKTRDVTVRTFGAPPYAAITATSDASAATNGDSAGCDGTTSACAPSARATPDDTQVHAVQRCENDPVRPGACVGKGITNVDVTQQQSTTKAWTNGTNAATGWNR